MPFPNVGGALRRLTSQVSVVDLAPEEAAEVENLVRNIEAIYDRSTPRAASDSQPDSATAKRPIRRFRLLDIE